MIYGEKAVAPEGTAMTTRQQSLVENLMAKKEFLVRELEQVEKTLELLEKNPETKAVLESLSRVANIYLK